MDAILCERYPQVDRRIIRAVVMEHGDDMQGAVDFIETEVLEPESSAEFVGTDQDESLSTASEAIVLSEAGSTSYEEVQGAFSPSTSDVNVETFSIVDEKNMELAWQSSSLYAVDTELIEQVIEQRKTDKQTLLDALEEVKQLRRKAKEAEEAAREAKLQSERAGEALYAKAAQVGLALVQAREENAIRAAEIHGEKAILATEAKELQSRLQEVRGFFDKAFDVLETAKATLMKRISDANEKASTASKESLKKEYAAAEALRAKEEEMAKEVETSERLNSEADARTREREFLINRGKEVDALQGEIAVLYEDAEVLKKKVDGLMESDYIEVIADWQASVNGAASIMSQNSASSIMSQNSAPVTSGASSSMSVKSTASWASRSSEDKWQMVEGEF